MVRWFSPKTATKVSPKTMKFEQAWSPCGGHAGGRGAHCRGGAPSPAGLFQLGVNDKRVFLRMVADAETVRTAADLAVLYISLISAGRVVHRSGVPLATARALKTGRHELNLSPGLTTRELRVRKIPDANSPRQL